MLDRIRQLEQAARPLDPGAGERRQLRQAVVASSERFLRQIETLKAFDDVPGQGIGLLDTPIPEEGLPVEAAIEILEREVIRPGGHPASGGHLAYIPGGGIYHSALGDFLAAVTNKSGPYLKEALEDPSEISPADLSPELSRPLRALRMWLPLLLVGTKPFAAAIDLALQILREQVVALTAPAPVCSRQSAECAAFV